MNQYRFKPKFGMTFATLIVMALCIRLGFWQYNKAQSKILAQQQIDQGLKQAPVKLPSIINDKDEWRYKRVSFKGVYKPEYQMILDNRVHNGKAGYHVITPVKIDGDSHYVLVNRGWIIGAPDRQLPFIATPEDEFEFVGDVEFPLDKVFTLEADIPKDAMWQPLWQHIDMNRYQSMVPFGVKPYIIRLSPNSTADGFVREWPVPKNRITVHLGYAYQWFGFAFTLFVIYIALNIKKLSKEHKENESIKS
jgi:surfeit locus 1 family protein